jgi:hypothetical protein
MTGFYKDYADSSDTHQNSAEASADAAEVSANEAAASAAAAQDLEVTSASFDTADGTLTLTKTNSGTVTTDLDGRYLTTHQDISGKADLAGATFTGAVSAPNIGIGTTSPANTLTVGNTENSIVDQDATVGIKCNANHKGIMLQENSGGEQWSIGVGEAGSLKFYDSAVATPAVTFEDVTGNVGIGTDSPSEALDVDGNIAVSGTVDGRDVLADGTKLDLIEANATADQTGAEIKSAYEAVADTNAFTDAEKTKLSNIEASADVTDTVNVTAAGALMDSEVTNLAQVKAFDSSDYLTTHQDISGKANLSGANFTGAVNIADDISLQFGNNDLRIYHDSTSNSSFIREQGTGSFVVQGNNLVLSDTNSSKYLFGISGGQTNLYYNGTEKLNTKSAGIGVTGDITLTGTVDGVDIATLNSNAIVDGDFTTAGIMTTDGSGGYSVDSSTYATETYVDTAVSNLVDSAPATLDTLNELASALGDDANFSTTVTTSIGTKWTEDATKIGNWNTAYSWGDHDAVGYLTAETNDLSTTVTWADVPDANITESSVTQHQAALSVTESQISDFGTYLTTHQDISGKANISGGTFTGNVNVQDGLLSANSGTQQPFFKVSTVAASGSAGVLVDGDIVVTGTVDGVDIAGLNTTVAGKANLSGATFSGNVSIGTPPSGTQSLLVAGVSNLYGGASVTGDITVTGTVDGRDVATDGARLDEAKKIPFSQVVSQQMNGSSPVTILDVQIPQTTVPSKQAIDFSMAVRRYNATNTLKKSSSYNILVQVMSKSITGVSLGTATYSSAPSTYNAWYYVSGDKTHLMSNKRGKFAASSTGSNSTNLQGLYYDDVNDRTYFRISKYPDATSAYNNVEVFYSLSGFTSPGTYVTQTGNKTRYNSLEPQATTSQSISLQEILPETTSRSYVRLQFDPVSSVTSITTYVEDLSGHVENLL